MKSNRKKNAIVISSIAVLAVIAMVIAVAATTHLICPGSGIITNVSVKNSGTGDAYGPGVTYMSHNITIEDNSTGVNGSLADWYTKVMYFNITGYNGTITNDDITNITIYNESGAGTLFGFNNTITGNDSVNITALADTWVNDTAINFSVKITINTTWLTDCATLAPNVTVGVQQWNMSHNPPGGNLNCTNTSYANDTLAESINVLDATAGTSTAHASPGGTFVVVGNVTVDPGDDDNAVNLTNITFRVNTSGTATNLTAADILHYALWKGANAVLNTGTDEKLDNTSATTLNVSFNGLNSTISAATTNRYFLTMNLSKNIPYGNMTYQGFVAAQNITINNGTGNCTATADFNQLVIMDRITNLTSSVYDAAVLIKVNLTSPAGINKSTVGLWITNENTSIVTATIKDGVVVNGTALTNHSLVDGATSGYIRVSMELQEGYYNFSTVYAENDLGCSIANDTTFNGIDFIVNMSGAALNVTPDNPALQNDGVAPRTAEENATINVTVMDKFDHNLVFNTSDVNVTAAKITLIKTVGSGTVIITKITPTFIYPNVTQPVQFNVSNTVAETITLTALDEGPEGLASGSANQEFTPRIGGVDVYAADGEILADGVDYELVYLQLQDASGDPISKEDITVGWSVVNQGVASATVDKGTEKTNASGIATLNITSATVSDKTMTITGWEKFTGSAYADSDTVLTKAGEVDNTNSKLYVNETQAPGTTQGTVNTTLIVGVLLRDSSGNLVTNEEVTLTVNTSATFADSTPTSDATTGWANTTIRLPTDVNVTMVRAITGAGNTTLTPPELNKTVNVTSIADVVTQIKPVTAIGLKNELGTPTVITIQLQDTHGNDNTTATADILITTNNPDLGNMTNTTAPSKTVNDDLWCAITVGGSTTFTYKVNSTEPGTATLDVNVTDYGFTGEIVITTSGPEGLNLTFNDTLPLVGEGVMATAQLTGEIGDIAIANVNITFTLRNPSNVLIDVNSTITNDAGIATYNFSETTRGVYTIKAKNDDDGHEKTNTITYVGNATQIWIAVNNTSPAVNDTITVYAIFKDDAGYNSSSVNTGNLDVNFLADDSSFGTSDIINGVATATYTQSTAGTVTIDVLYTNTTNPFWEGTVATNSTSVTFGEAEECSGDFTNDGYVNIDDVVYLVNNLWGPCTPGAEGDFTNDGYVNIDDVVYLVNNLWGPCP